MRIRALAVVASLSFSALLLALALPTGAQVTARQGGPEEEGEPVFTEVPSPMVLELVVPAWKPEKRTAKLQWVSSETAKFVSDKARIRRVSIVRLPRPERGAKPAPGRKWTKNAAMELEINVTAVSDWMRQDIDLSVTISDSAGLQLATKTWDDLTIGKGGNSITLIGGILTATPKTVTLVAPLSEEQVARLEREPQQLKIVVDIQDDEEED